jgi:hypothetical protein
MWSYALPGMSTVCTWGGVAGKLPIQKKWGDFFGQISVEIFLHTYVCNYFGYLTCPNILCKNSHLLNLCNFAQV